MLAFTQNYNICNANLGLGLKIGSREFRIGIKDWDWNCFEREIVDKEFVIEY